MSGMHPFKVEKVYCINSLNRKVIALIAGMFGVLIVAVVGIGLKLSTQKTHSYTNAELIAGTRELLD